MIHPVIAEHSPRLAHQPAVPSCCCRRPILPALAGALSVARAQTLAHMHAPIYPVHACTQFTSYSPSACHQLLLQKASLLCSCRSPFWGWGQPSKHRQHQRTCIVLTLNLLSTTLTRRLSPAAVAEGQSYLLLHELSLALGLIQLHTCMLSTTLSMLHTFGVSYSPSGCRQLLLQRANPPCSCRSPFWGSGSNSHAAQVPSAAPAAAGHP
jgi:hypothetical protein